MPGAKVSASAPSAEDAAAAAASASEANASTGMAAPSSAAAPAAAAAAPSSSTPAAQPDAPVGAKQAVWAALGVEDFDEAAATALKKALENAGADAANDVYEDVGDSLPLLQHAIKMEDLGAGDLGPKVKLLLEMGARPEAIDPADDEGESALHLAAHTIPKDPAYNGNVMAALLRSLQLCPF